jgi:hypothetical protein
VSCMHTMSLAAMHGSGSARAKKSPLKHSGPAMLCGTRGASLLPLLRKRPASVSMVNE